MLQSRERLLLKALAQIFESLSSKVQHVGDVVALHRGFVRALSAVALDTMAPVQIEVGEREAQNPKRSVSAS